MTISSKVAGMISSVSNLISRIAEPVIGGVVGLLFQLAPGMQGVPPVETMSMGRERPTACMLQARASG